MAGQISLLKIEIDGHFHGSPDVPKPWVAEVTGLCPKYGLARTFIQPMNDWAEAHKAWSGNIYRRVAQFALREGNLYEVSRLKGTPSKRHQVREFLHIVDGKRKVLSSEEALALTDGHAEACLVRIPEDREGGSWVARVYGLGTPKRLGFVVTNANRLYRCQDGLYERNIGERKSFFLVQDLVAKTISERDALERLWQAANVA